MRTPEQEDAMNVHCAWLCGPDSSDKSIGTLLDDLRSILELRDEYSGELYWFKQPISVDKNMTGKR
jgi:hypothetical protein